MLRYSIDGGVTWIEVDEIRVEGPRERTAPEVVLLTINNEGIVYDVTDTDADEVVATEYVEWSDHST